MVQLSRRFFYQAVVNVAVLQPRARRDAPGLGCSAFARRYLRNHCCFLFLQVLRCFSSLRSPHFSGNTSSRYWVPPFGNPRIKGHLRLPAAYRSLSRPSSPLRAKASPVRSYLTFSSRVLCLRTHVSPSRENKQACFPLDFRNGSIVKTCFIADSLGRPLQLTFDSWVCISADFLFSLICLLCPICQIPRALCRA